jgi:hypothetical protein
MRCCALLGVVSDTPPARARFPPALAARMPATSAGAQSMCLAVPSSQCLCQHIEATTESSASPGRLRTAPLPQCAFSSRGPCRSFAAHFGAHGIFAERQKKANKKPPGIHLRSMPRLRLSAITDA